MALGHFLFKNDDVRTSSICTSLAVRAVNSPSLLLWQACELVGMLGLDLAPFRQSSSSKIAAVAREVTSLLS